MTIIFNEPKIKRNYYLATTQQPINHDIIDAIVKKVTKLECNKGYLLSIYIGKQDQDVFNDIDDKSLESLVDKNDDWFDNDLNTDDINNLFKRSVCEQNNIINIYLTDNTQIIKDGIARDTMEEMVVISDSTKMKQYTINLKLRHSGMYIYSSHTVNKWYVKSIQMYSLEDEEVDRDEINNFWLEQIKECQETLENRKKMIDNTQNKLKNMYLNTLDTNIPNKEWEMKLSEIKQIIQNIIFL